MVACDVENPTLGRTGQRPSLARRRVQRRSMGAAGGRIGPLLHPGPAQVGVDVRALGGGARRGRSPPVWRPSRCGAAQRHRPWCWRRCASRSGWRASTLVITGEGRMDSQTLGGKGPFGVAMAARARGVPDRGSGWRHRRRRRRAAGGGLAAVVADSRRGRFRWRTLWPGPCALLERAASAGRLIALGKSRRPGGGDDEQPAVLFRGGGPFCARESGCCSVSSSCGGARGGNIPASGPL
jgi:hypothetical protein